MGRRSRNPGQQPVDGFRPGKEPPHLKKRRARQQLGKDASWAQKQVVEAIGDKSPEEVQGMMKRWTMILAAVGVALVVLGALLYSWSIIAGVLVHLLALAVGFFWFRMRRQQAQLIAAAEALSGGGKSRRKGRRG